VLYPAELRDRALHKWMMRRALATTFLAQGRRAQSLYCAASSTIDDAHVPVQPPAEAFPRTGHWGLSWYGAIKRLRPTFVVSLWSFTSEVATVGARYAGGHLSLLA
jgi:hypothetical protein